VPRILGSSHIGVNNFSRYLGSYTELGVLINNQCLTLADKAKKSKLRVIAFIDPVHGLDKPVSRS
jgi:hypothetical protein